MVWISSNIARYLPYIFFTYLVSLLSNIARPFPYFFLPTYLVLFHRTSLGTFRISSFLPTWSGIYRTSLGIFHTSSFLPTWSFFYRTSPRPFRTSSFLPTWSLFHRASLGTYRISSSLLPGLEFIEYRLGLSVYLPLYFLRSLFHRVSLGTFRISSYLPTGLDFIEHRSVSSVLYLLSFYLVWFSLIISRNLPSFFSPSLFHRSLLGIFLPLFPLVPWSGFLWPSLGISLLSSSGLYFIEYYSVPSVYLLSFYLVWFSLTIARNLPSLFLRSLFYRVSLSIFLLLVLLVPWSDFHWLSLGIFLFISYYWSKFLWVSFGIFLLFSFNYLDWISSSIVRNLPSLLSVYWT